MANPTVVERANSFRAMHQPGDPIVLINIWDVASARVVASQPGTRALATASWSVCAATGYVDGGGLPLKVALLTAKRIVDATDLPVTIDFEKGYADTAKDVRENTLRLIATGAIGLNLEDSIGSEEGPNWNVSEASARVAAVRAAADESGVPLVINARTDVFIGGGAVEDAIVRGRAYLDAGADCIFVPGADRNTVRELIENIPGPVSVTAGANSPTIAEFADLGVARVSFGPGPMGVAYSALARFVDEVSFGRTNAPDLAYRPGCA